MSGPALWPYSREALVAQMVPPQLLEAQVRPALQQQHALARLRQHAGGPPPPAPAPTMMAS